MKHDYGVRHDLRLIIHPLLTDFSWLDLGLDSPVFHGSFKTGFSRINNLSLASINRYHSSLSLETKNHQGVLIKISTSAYKCAEMEMVMPGRPVCLPEYMTCICGCVDSSLKDARAKISDMGYCKCTVFRENFLARL